MKPTWETKDGTVRLYLGDCLEILPTLGKVDAVVTDPPYGVREDAWDDLNAYDFARVSMAWLAEAKRVAREVVAFCVNDGPFRRICELLYPEVRTVVWSKPLGSQYNGASHRGLWYAHETILHCHNGDAPKGREVAELLRAARKRAGLSCGAVDVAIRGKKTGLCYRWEEAACLPTPEQVKLLKPLLGLNGDLDAALDAAYAAKSEGGTLPDVLQHRTVTEGRHGCEKPEGLMVDLLESIGRNYRTVLDPFMGSGTTGVACVRTGRSFIGIEKEPKYFDSAADRIEKELNRHPLLEPQPQIQRSLLEAQ